MLARPHRFHGLTALTFVHRRGQSVRGALLGLRYARNDRRETYRVAVIVSRKVHKSAVQRNRVRRRIYEAVRTAPPITVPYDLVISVYSDHVYALPAPELQQQVTALLRKAGVYQTS